MIAAPMLILFKGGAQIAQKVGYQTKKMLKDWLLKKH